MKKIVWHLCLAAGVDQIIGYGTSAQDAFIRAGKRNRQLICLHCVKTEEFEIAAGD